ncbi:NAD(P)-dependent dehydrogenase [Yamadazyma tenuis]|uniref:NAD(P)-binding protein n=1 Tax=Candida tenuis (strain ATCC 10573 / BCRC 21748 / CBS 615 / JCM 9827 / NBRC 10315 / NRRL Y-1498 / VKM Y-70) TaxID=590646 RepID=G3BFM4_CANTC|nr:NAD(P)-binding protein [Yamadazyma tenuis ATCC 10573]EGV60053.1 NAD(P)-binding protein [Yamadazyma tenuis ATCC 10573]WEJ94718.1 NAD(P)-dependent dehydrogenase [Yamadazyma tenuis]
MPTYFIAGANRGIGYSYVKLLSADPSNLVIATVRNHHDQSLQDLKRPNLKVVHVDMTDPYATFVEAFRPIEKWAPDGVDVMIHNAAVIGSPLFVPIEQYDVDKYPHLLSVNVGGPAKTYKALYPYIFKGKHPKRIVFISSLMGQFGLSMHANAYGAAKAGLNHLGVQIAGQNATADNQLIRESVTVLVHPGEVDTDGAAEGKTLLAPDQFITPDHSASETLKLVDRLTVADSGKFFVYNGQEIPF